MFGVRRARADIDRHGNIYYPYVRRPFDDHLDDALDRRVHGSDRQMLLIVGEAMNGKSRASANALRKHPSLSTLPLLVPHSSANLRDVVELAPPAGAVLWLDDLNIHPDGFDAGALRDWQTRPGLVVIATLRSDLEREFREPHLRPAWDAIKDAALIERLDMPTEWSEQEQQALSEAEPIIQSKVGGYLSARSSVPPMSYANTSRQRIRSRRQSYSPSETGHALGLLMGYQKSSPNSCGRPTFQGRTQPFSRIATSTNVTTSISKPFNGHGSRFRAPARCFSPASLTACTSTTISSLIHLPTYQPPRTRFGRLLFHHAISDQYAKELPFIGLRAAEAGETEIARAAYQVSIERNDPWSAIGKLGLGSLLQKEGDTFGALTLTGPLIGSFFKDMAPSLLQVGLLMAGQGKLDSAKHFLQIVSYSGHPDQAPRAALALGQLLVQQGDIDGARAAYQIAIDSGHEDHAPLAALALGLLLAEQGDIDEATELPCRWQLRRVTPSMPRRPRRPR